MTQRHLYVVQGAADSQQIGNGEIKAEKKSSLKIWQHRLLNKGEQYAELNLAGRLSGSYRWKNTCCVYEDFALVYWKNLNMQGCEPTDFVPL